MKRLINNTGTGGGERITLNIDGKKVHARLHKRSKHIATTKGGRIFIAVIKNGCITHRWEEQDWINRPPQVRDEDVRSGTKSTRYKRGLEQAREIRQMWREGNHTVAELQEIFQYKSIASIYRIINNESYTEAA